MLGLVEGVDKLGTSGAVDEGSVEPGAEGVPLEVGAEFVLEVSLEVGSLTTLSGAIDSGALTS